MLLSLSLSLSHHRVSEVEGEVGVGEVEQGLGHIVTVEEPPISFSLFTSADCSLFSHFSFNDFITTAFLDLAEHLDIQI